MLLSWSRHCDIRGGIAYVGPQFVDDILHCVFLQRLGPVEVACPLMSFDWNLGIAYAINNLYSIPIGLSIARHKSSKVWLRDSLPKHHMVEVLSENYVSIFVLALEIEASNGHDKLVCLVVDIACHSGSIGDMLDIVRYDPRILR